MRQCKVKFRGNKILNLVFFQFVHRFTAGKKKRGEWFSIEGIQWILDYHVVIGRKSIRDISKKREGLVWRNSFKLSTVIQYTNNALIIWRYPGGEGFFYI